MGTTDNKKYTRFTWHRNGSHLNEQQDELLTKGTVQPTSHTYINRHQDDEMEVYCYRISKLRTVITYILFAATGGILRLLFHWVPHWYILMTCQLCDVEHAHKVLVMEIFRGKHRTYHVKTLKTLTPDIVKRLKQDNDQLNSQYNKEKFLPTLSIHIKNGIFKDMDKIIMFNCKKLTYIWDYERKEFHKLHGLDFGVNSELFHNSKGLTINEQFIRRLIYGPNKIIVRENSIIELLFLEVLNPFYIFQIASFLLWYLDDYYYYAATIMLMSIFGIVMSVKQIRENQHNLKSTVNCSDVCTVMRRLEKKSDCDAIYRPEIISTELLVPGDVLVIPSHGCIMHCDALLLTGNCILNESMLTGESVPVTKTAFPHLSDLIYDQKEHGRHTLFCGTKIIQTRYFGDEKVLAVVLRTGFQTAKGSLVRSILYPPPVDFRFEKDSYRFVALLAGVACIGFIYTVITKVMRGVSTSDLLVEAFDLITIVVPPALPAAMTVGCFYAQMRLKKKQIFSISPRTINVAGSIDCVCFDKTGTLTEDGLDLLCVVPTGLNGQFHQPITEIDRLPYDTLLYGLVSCHSLTIIDKQIVGDPLDLKMFESTHWLMEEHDVADVHKFNMLFPTVLKAPKNERTSRGETMDDAQIGIIREFPFSSNSQRMGVIVRKLDGINFEYYCKGSPEILLEFCHPNTIPENFHQILEEYTQRGYRVIALAHKELSHISYAKVQKITRESLEINLRMLALIVLENRLKTETTSVIRALNDATIRTIMVTGDNILTALSVAKECELIRKGQCVITVNADTTVSPPQLYYTLNNTLRIGGDCMIGNPASISESIVSATTMESQLKSDYDDSVGVRRPMALYNLNNYRFAMIGRVWDVIREYHPELIGRLVTRGSVFARMSPEQKQQLVEELQNLGYCVSMCGDGANDCGALKAAHVGISLSETEASVASPFTSKTPDVACVVHVIKEGRAALVTSFGIFKYMAAYSLCQFVSVMILYSIDSNLTDIEFLYIDLFIISIFAFVFGHNAAYPGKLARKPPLSSLISPSPILSLGLQMALVIVVQMAALAQLRAQPWYTPYAMHGNMDDKDEVACVENYTIYTVSSFQYIILAIVFAKGKPYRTPLWKNYGFIISAICLTTFSIYLAIDPAEWIRKQFDLSMPPNYEFRVMMLVYVMIEFIIGIVIEHLLIDGLLAARLRHLFIEKHYQMCRHLAIEREINADTKWPILTSDYRSAASPAQPGDMTVTAEIVIENERFAKGHVLNRLYENEIGNTDVINTTPTSPISPPPLPQSTPSSGTTGTYKSLANSQSNIDELPYDDCVLEIHINGDELEMEHLTTTINNNNNR